MSIHLHVFQWKQSQHGYIERIVPAPDRKVARRIRLASYSREVDRSLSASDVREIISALLDDLEAQDR